MFDYSPEAREDKDESTDQQTDDWQTSFHFLIFFSERTGCI